MKSYLKLNEELGKFESDIEKAGTGFHPDICESEYERIGGLLEVKRNEWRNAISADIALIEEELSTIGPVVKRDLTVENLAALNYQAKINCAKITEARDNPEGIEPVLVDIALNGDAMERQAFVDSYRGIVSIVSTSVLRKFFEYCHKQAKESLKTVEQRDYEAAAKDLQTERVSLQTLLIKMDLRIKSLKNKLNQKRND